MPLKKIKKPRLSVYQQIVTGFAAVILLGALLLALPISHRNGAYIPFPDALFTSVSAVCVTGLVVRDTAASWSGFGQFVILSLIQIGGLGVVTIAVAITLAADKDLSPEQRRLFRESVSMKGSHPLEEFARIIFLVTVCAEAGGAILMMPSFVGRFGPRGIWMALFHSISAFCNAGFDLMGTKEAPFASLTSWSSDPVVCIVIMLLIICGGLGFLTWEDLFSGKRTFRQYRLQTKVVLAAAAVLIFLPALLLLFTEYRDLPAGKRILSSLFQSVTTRTAGFNTMDLAKLSGITRAVMIFLMLVGASPGSTAGGMKTTTLAMLAADAAAIFRHRDSAELFGRRIETEAVRTASAVLLLYITLFFTGGILISAGEGLPLGVCLFEAASALGTVGLTLGITPSLGTASRIILMLLMFAGRAGSLTLIYAAVHPKRTNEKLPMGHIST